MMKTHSLVVIASGLDPHAEDFEDRFFDAGCDDATIVVQKGAIVVEFDRWAESFSEALGSALANVCAAGAKVVRVEPDHLVSLSDVAARAGLTRAAVSHYAKGERGEQFPAPVVRVTSESPLWDWAEVARGCTIRAASALRSCFAPASCAARTCDHGAQRRLYC